MSLFSLQNIQKAYFGRSVLAGVSLRLDRGDRVALIGENGAGKTTLLRLITGAEKPDMGSIITSERVVVGYLSQHVEDICDLDSHSLVSQELTDLEDELRQLEIQMGHHLDDKQLLTRYAECTARYEALDGYDFPRRMQEALEGLGLSGDAINRPLSTLSGGERMRVALARLLLRAPDVLLLDEPTNHMDASAQEWLENYLQRFKGAVLLVSHDRAFIDQVATTVAELSMGQLTVRPGNYSNFKMIEANDQLTLIRTIKQMEKDLAHQESVTQTMLSHRKMSSYHAREKVVAKLSAELDQIRDRAKLHQTQLKFNFLPVQNSGDKDKQLLLASDLEIAFNARTLFTQVNFEVRGRDKLCVCGPNGCGKSTLLALLLGKIPSSTGTLRLASGAVFGHMGQHVQFQDEHVTVLAELLSRFDLDESGGRSLLARYGFRDVDVFKSISVLSGGERARLYLCCLLLEQPDLLLLDEPTNHLDIHSREILEQALLDFPGAIFAVSHDRYFIDRIARKILGFIGTAVKPFETYENYRVYARAEQVQTDLTAKASKAEKAAIQDSQRSSPPKSAAFAEKPAVLSNLNKSQERKENARRKEMIRAAEVTIEQLEAERDELETRFGSDARAEDYARYAVVLEEIDATYVRYLELSES
ncbi:MAG: ABC-F family ATP-binding cassette domain-containing protein [Eubacteriales bacterium]|nr:ABC-F family ATP-binding cassette domain-containing protein [Eubacteriales bacterium]